MFSDYEIARRLAQPLNATGARPRFGVRRTTVQRNSYVRAFYEVIPLP